MFKFTYSKKRFVRTWAATLKFMGWDRNVMSIVRSFVSWLILTTLLFYYGGWEEAWDDFYNPLPPIVAGVIQLLIIFAVNWELIPGRINAERELKIKQLTESTQGKQITKARIKELVELCNEAWPYTRDHQCFAYLPEWKYKVRKVLNGYLDEGEMAGFDTVEDLENDGRPHEALKGLIEKVRRMIREYGKNVYAESQSDGKDSIEVRD